MCGDSPTLCRAPQVVQETGQLDGTELAFTGMLFQPVPWSLKTKKGMPADYEQYAADSDYVIINTPPNFMFQVDPTPWYLAILEEVHGMNAGSVIGHMRLWSAKYHSKLTGLQLIRWCHCAGQDLQAFTTLCYIQEEVTVALQCCKWQESWVR